MDQDEIMFQVLEYKEIGELFSKKFVFDEWEEYQHLGEFRFVNTISGEVLTLFKRNISSVKTSIYTEEYRNPNLN